jgi:hypothetical protein
MLAAQASGAQVHTFGLTIYNQGDRVNIGHPVAIGMTFRVAYIVAKLGRFAT